MSFEKTIPPGLLVQRKAACAILGLSYDTLTVWLRKGCFELPSGPTFAGRELWSAQDIERLRLFAKLRRSTKGCFEIPSAPTFGGRRRSKVGRPKVIRDPAKIAALAALRSQGLSWRRVALEMGISVSTAIKILRDREIA